MRTGLPRRFERVFAQRLECLSARASMKRLHLGFNWRFDRRQRRVDRAK
jgi:hypothetical protein